MTVGAAWAWPNVGGANRRALAKRHAVKDAAKTKARTETKAATKTTAPPTDSSPTTKNATTAPPAATGEAGGGGEGEYMEYSLTRVKKRMGSTATSRRAGGGDALGNAKEGGGEGEGGSGGEGEGGSGGEGGGGGGGAGSSCIELDRARSSEQQPAHEQPRALKSWQYIAPNPNHSPHGLPRHICPHGPLVFQ